MSQMCCQMVREWVRGPGTSERRSLRHVSRDVTLRFCDVASLDVALFTSPVRQCVLLACYTWNQRVYHQTLCIIDNTRTWPDTQPFSVPL